MKVTTWADINGIPTVFCVTDDEETTEFGRFPSEAEAAAFLQGFLAGQANWSDPADLNAAAGSEA